MDVWRRIDDWLESHAPDVLAALRPPAAAEDLARVERALRRALPRDVVDAYRAHDGVARDASALFGAFRLPEDAAWARAMSWLPIAEALAQWKEMPSLVEGWPLGHFPIAIDAGGNLVVVDVDTNGIFAWDHETGETTRISADLASLLSTLANDMDAGLVEVDTENDYATSLVRMDKAAPRVGPDRAARVFLQELVERRYVELEEGADVEALLLALRPALARADIEGVVAALERSPVVAEIYAADDVLRVLIDACA